jgi:HK97 family phage portal protein
MRALGEAILNIPSLFTKRHTNARDYFASTIQTGDIGNKWLRRDDQYALVASYVGMTYICASIVGTACASGTIRLYRPVRGKSKGRKLNRKQKAWMRSTVPGYGPGTKAARMASNSDEIEEITDSPVIDLLNRPNNLDVSLVEDKLRFVNQGLCGNHYVNVITRGGQPVELLPMYPQWTRLLLGSEGPYAVRYGINGAQERDFPLDEVIHFKHESDPQNRWYGRGVLKAMWVEHQIMLACNQKDLCLFDNQARPDFAVMVKQGGNQDMITQTEQKLRSKFQGVNKSGNFVVLSGESVDIKPLAFSPKDMADDQTRDRLGGYIAAAWGVPESLIKMNEANLASATAGNAAFARYTVLPRLNQDAAVWTEKLLPMFGYAPGEAWLAYDNVVPEDEVGRSTVMVAKVGAGIITINEARADEGYEPIDGGDEVRIAGRSLESIDAPPVPMFGAGPTGSGDKPKPEDGKTDPKNDAPLSEAPDKAEEKSGIVVVRRKVDERADNDTAGDQDHPAARLGEQAQPQAGVESGRNGPEVARRDGKGACAGDPCGCDVGTCKRSQREACGIGAIELVRKAAELDPPGLETEPPDVAYYRKLAEWFHSQRDAIIGAMDKAPFGLQTRQLRRKAMTELERMLAAWGVGDLAEASVVKIAHDTIGFIATGVQDGAETGLISVAQKYPDAFPVPQNPRDVIISAKPVADAIRTQETAYIQHLREVNGTTADQLKATLIQGIENNESLSGLKDRVRAVFDAPTSDGTPMSDYRAAMIARTEVAEAQTTGTIAGYKATGLKMRKAWLLAGGACPWCVAAAEQFNSGNAIDLDQPFFPLGSTITAADGSTMAIDYRAIQAAPLHPQCRCSVESVLDE